MRVVVGCAGATTCDTTARDIVNRRSASLMPLVVEVNLRIGQVGCPIIRADLGNVAAWRAAACNRVV